MQHFNPIMECSSTSVLQNYAFYSGQIEAFWKVLPLLTVALTARAFSHWPGATWLLNKWLYWEFRQCGQWENPVTHELLSIPGFPKSFCSALLPVVRFCWAFEWVMGKQELWDCPSVQGGDEHLCSKLSPQLFQISAPSIYMQAGFGWLRCLARHDQSRVCFVWVPSKVWGGPCLVWAKLLMWVRRSFGQRQEGWWSDSCPPGEVERNSHRCLWNPLLLPLESSQSSSITPQGQNTSAAVGQWSDFSRAASLQGCPRKCPPLSAALLPHLGSTWLFTLS